MSNERNKPWLTKKGEPVTFNDCKNAVHSAISCMTKELKTNKVIYDSQSLAIKYDHQIRVLEVIKEKFDLLDKQTKKVQRKTVKKRKKMIH